MSGNTAETEREEGSVLILTIGFVVVIMLFVGVVVDSSKLFLTRRALASVADGAALAAAQEVDIAEIYLSSAGATLPLSPATARADVDSYVRRAAAETGLTDLQVIAVDIVGQDVQVTIRGRSVLPLISLATDGNAGVLITVSAHARAAVAR
jgi:Flp pilus assembly protein TadG